MDDKVSLIVRVHEKEVSMEKQQDKINQAYELIQEGMPKSVIAKMLEITEHEIDHLQRVVK